MSDPYSPARPAGRVLAFPKGGIAYNESLYRAMEKRGVPVVDGSFSGRWLWHNVKSGDWAHLHWPSFEYAAAKTVARLVWNFVRFVALLLLIRAKGARLAWTAHNLLPHDRTRIGVLDVAGRHLVIRLSAIVFAHGRAAAETIAQRFPAATRRLVLIPHGNWIDEYDIETSQATARASLALNEKDFVYLFFGSCRPYKNLEALLTSFARLGGDVALVIAGSFQHGGYLDRVVALAARDKRVRLDARFIPDQDLPTYFAASDVVVAPYREILTSGTAMLAMSFGRPLISVNAGFLREVSTEATAILYRSDDAAGLDGALARAKTRDFDFAAIVAHARRYTFDDAARISIAAFFPGKTWPSAPASRAVRDEANLARSSAVPGPASEHESPSQDRSRDQGEVLTAQGSS